MTSRAVLIGLASQASAASCMVRSRASALRLLRRLAALLDRGLAVVRDRRLHRLDQRRQRRFGVGRHRHVDRLEALEVLIVRLGEQLDRVDADQLGARLDLGPVDADAVLAVVDVAVHHAPEVGQLHADDDVGIG